MYTVLLVENDEHQRVLYERELTEAGFLALSARNASQALGIVRQQRPDMVVLDLHMPGMDGLEALPRFLALEPGLPVIIYTGYSCYRDNFAAWMADAYLVKSSDLRPLKATIDRVLEERRRRPPQIELPGRRLCDAREIDDAAVGPPTMLETVCE